MKILMLGQSCGRPQYRCTRPFGVNVDDQLSGLVIFCIHISIVYWSIQMWKSAQDGDFFPHSSTRLDRSPRLGAPCSNYLGLHSIKPLAPES